MDSMVVGSFLNASSITTGGNLSQGKNCAKNYYATSFYTPKASHKRKIQKEYNFLRSRQPSLKHLYKGIEGGSTYQECNRKYVVQTAPKPSFESDPRSIDQKYNLESVKTFLDAFYMFCTPYAFICIVLYIASMSLLAVEKLSDISPLFFIGILQAYVPYLFIHIYVAGLNQVCDVEIDKINKPYLPLASGKISFTTGVIIVVSCLILVLYIFIPFYNDNFQDDFTNSVEGGLLFYYFVQGLWLSLIVGSWPSTWALISLVVTWGAYSINVPLLRWKKNPVLAAMCNFLTFAVTFPLGYFFHMQTFVFKRPAFFPRPLIFATTIMSFFSLVIALFKDLPDIEGDQAFGVKTFATRFGQKWVFWICISLLEMAYGVAILMGATSSFLWSKIVTGLGHAVLASFLLYRAKSIDLRSKASITSFYKLIWKLMCVEYFLMPLVR